MRLTFLHVLRNFIYVSRQLIMKGELITFTRLQGYSLNNELNKILDVEFQF